MLRLDEPEPAAIYLVTDPAVREELFLLGGRGALMDLVLDDGTYVPDAVVDGTRALGALAGRAGGVLPFSELPALAGRRIRACLRLGAAQRAPLLGALLRRLWARRHGSSGSRPTWLS